MHPNAQKFHYFSAVFHLLEFCFHLRTNLHTTHQKEQFFLFTLCFIRIPHLKQTLMPQRLKDNGNQHSTHNLTAEAEGNTQNEVRFAKTKPAFIRAWPGNSCLWLTRTHTVLCHAVLQLFPQWDTGWCLDCSSCSVGG